jgi:hypothetical protein
MASMQSSAFRERPHRVAVAIVAAICGLALVAFGWLIPSQFKSLPVSVLAEAGRGTPSLASSVRDALDAGQPGVASIFADAAARVKQPDASALAEKVQAFLGENPDLAAWGEANAHLTNALGSPHAVATDAKGGVVRLFLPAAARQSLKTYLGNSRNATTRAILATAQLKSYRQFLPVFSSGGAPLEATILLAAMLVQTDDLGNGAVRELRAVAEEATKSGDATKLELTYLDLLSLGRRYNWGQLAALVRGADSLDTLAKLRHLHQVAPDAAPVLAAAVIMSKRTDAVVDYLIHFGERGMETIAFSLYHGGGSLDLLLRQQLPADGDVSLPPASAAQGLAHNAVDPLVRFALRSPAQAVAAKFGAYLLGGLLLFLTAERLTALRRIELSPVYTLAARAVGAIVICLFLVVVNEPYLALGSQPAGYELHLVIPVLGSTSVDSMNQSSNPFPVDTATLISIAFFFLLQALVYLICLLKMREIEGKPVPPLLKLRLAENEENLFDSGLYVGIAGTSAALVLPVLHVIEANLLAAYSSNLFGILCVAFVKIRHVRPLKQRLILQAAEASSPGSVSEISRVG